MSACVIVNDNEKRRINEMIKKILITLAIIIPIVVVAMGAYFYLMAMSSGLG
jgi:flagellar basal body-associated protein FliL